MHVFFCIVWVLWVRCVFTCILIGQDDEAEESDGSDSSSSSDSDSSSNESGSESESEESSVAKKGKATKTPKTTPNKGKTSAASVMSKEDRVHAMLQVQGIWIACSNGGVCWSGM